jgi:NAD(P)H-flavin reductase/ferredoxin
MPSITFESKSYPAEAGESVLDTLLRQGVDIPCTCRSGVCQTCLMRVVAGDPGTKAQAGLKTTLKAQGYFLPCVCVPTGNLEVMRPAADIMVRTLATVVGKEALNQDILRLSLRCRSAFDYHPGQFIHLYRGDGLMRSYSLASVPCPSRETELELHVRKLPAGRMSNWIHEDLTPGETVEVRGPAGECHYVPGKEHQPLLLVGTGSGLAPLWGIVKDALRQGHLGPIHLYHGSWRAAGLYLVEEARQLAREHPNFLYFPCVDELEAEAGEGFRAERVDKAALSDLPNLKGWRVFLCGHPDLIAGMRKRTFLAGASMQEIFADPFVLTKPS